jgi:hypothetical protein
VRIVKNLGQINDVPAFTRSERMRFYNIYRAAGGGELSNEGLRAVAAYTRRRIQKRVKKMSRGRRGSQKASEG